MWDENMMKKRAKNGNGGFTLLEVILSIAILGLITLPLLNYFLDSLKHAARTAQQQKATLLAQDTIESLKAYDKLITRTVNESESYYWVSVLAGRYGVPTPTPAPGEAAPEYSVYDGVEEYNKDQGTTGEGNPLILKKEVERDGQEYDVYVSLSTDVDANSVERPVIYGVDDRKNVMIVERDQEQEAILRFLAMNSSYIITREVEDAASEASGSSEATTSSEDEAEGLDLMAESGELSGEDTEGSSGEDTEGSSGEGTEGSSGEDTEGSSGEDTEGSSGEGTEGSSGEGTGGSSGGGSAEPVVELTENDVRRKLQREIFIDVSKEGVGDDDYYTVKAYYEYSCTGVTDKSKDTYQTSNLVDTRMAGLESIYLLFNMVDPNTDVIHIKWDVTTGASNPKPEIVLVCQNLDQLGGGSGSSDPSDPGDPADPADPAEPPFAITADKYNVKLDLQGFNWSASVSGTPDHPVIRTNIVEEDTTESKGSVLPLDGATTFQAENVVPLTTTGRAIRVVQMEVKIFKHEDSVDTYKYREPLVVMQTTKGE